jgi:hypothetical protein
VQLTPVAVREDLLTVAVEYFSDPLGRELPADAVVSVNWSGWRDGAWPNRMETLGMAVLTAERVPAPPDGPCSVGVAYPLAFDRDGRVAAVSFAALNVYPDHQGWWCLVEQFWRADDGHWAPAGGSYDNTTTDTPFQRPTTPENSRHDWIDWATEGGRGVWEAEPRHRFSYCGIAPAQTASLSVTTPDGRSRDVAISPGSGAWVVVTQGTGSTLTGRDAAGTVLGTETFGA